MPQRKDIRYLNRNFADFRKELIDYTKNYFPDTHNDFSAASPGVMFIEMASYVGDVLSFYQDQQLQETFIKYAKNPSSIFPIAYMMGYRPKVSTASQVRLTITQTINTGSVDQPDYSLAGSVSENTPIAASTGNNTNFIIPNSINFTVSSSLDPTEVTINGDGTVTLTKFTNAFSADVVETDIVVGADFERFKTITIDDESILGILEIVDDSESNKWYEVPFLGQSTVIVPDDSGSIPNTLKLEKVDRRFVTRFTSNGQLQVQFGAGIESDTSTEESFLPSPSNVGFNPDGDGTLKTAFDPSNFLFTKSYGLAPINTTLTVRYLRGGGIQSNEEAGAINSTIAGTTIIATNEEPATGGRDGDTVEEIRENALRAFAEQQRTVTTNDYVVRALSMPARFGVVSKAFATRDTFSGIRSSLSPLEVSLYVLGSNTDGSLITATSSLKQNLRKYLSQFIMITDNVTIKDAFVVNIGVDYEVSILPEALGREVLLRCNQAVAEYFDTSRFTINQVIDLNDLSVTLDRVDGVKTVKNIKIFNKAGELDGREYSEFKYDMQPATRENVIYPSLDPSLFELKFPDSDIRGRITSI